MLASLWDRWLEFYKTGDPRTEYGEVYLMGPRSIVSVAALLVSYWALVLGGPRLMADCRPWDLRLPMLLYNVAMVGLNGYIVWEVTLASWAAGYQYFRCIPVDYSLDSPAHLRVLHVLWWFVLSKFVELVDTLFLVLRKKTGQLSFLHVYHHSSMVLLVWFGHRWAGDGPAFYVGFVNCSIHVVMYAYYAVAAVAPAAARPLKRCLTAAQLSQFAFGLWYLGTLWWLDCPIPQVVYGCFFFMIATFMVLFINFWLKAYSNKDLVRKAAQACQPQSAEGDASKKTA